MTNTLTTDVEGTVAQIRRSEDAGVDIVRVSCPDQESAFALKEIVRQVKVPIVADIHFHYKRAIEAAQSGAACLRINPGNIGSPERVREVIQAARDYGCSMRIGVNAGSLERHLLEKYGEPNPEALVESALEHAKILQDNDFHEFKISVKASDVFMAVAAYTQLAEVCDHPLHIGITEAGSKRAGTVKSSIGLGNLLWAGIGDTLRVSLSAVPEEEVLVGWDLLKSLGLRHRGREDHLVPVLRAAGLQRDRHGAEARGSVGAHQDAADVVDHRLRGERAGRGADDRSGRDRRRQRAAHGVCGGQDRPHDGWRRHDRAHRRIWSSARPRRWRPKRSQRRSRSQRSNSKLSPTGEGGLRDRFG